MKVPVFPRSLGVGMLGSFSFSFCLSPPAMAQETPANVTIETINVLGSGCPHGSVTSNLAADRKSFTVIFRDYIAEIGPGRPLSDSRNSCQLTLDLHTPPGWRFAVASFTHRGFFDLNDGILAKHSTIYYFQGQILNGEFHENIKGPGRSSFHFKHDVALPDVLWSSCDRNRALNIKSSLRLEKPQPEAFPHASGIIGTDAIDGSLHSQEWRLLWARCP